MNHKLRFIKSLLLFLITIYILELLVSHLLYAAGSRSFFLFSSDYIINQLLTVGGLSLLISDFSLQFVHIPFCGSLMVALMLSISYYLLSSTRFYGDEKLGWDYLSIMIVPQLYLLSSISAIDFSFEYLVSIFVCSLLLNLVSRYRSLLLAIVVTVLGYCFAAATSVVVPIVVALFFRDIKFRYLPLLIFVFLPLIDALIEVETASSVYKMFLSVDVWLLAVSVATSVILSAALPILKKGVMWILFALSLSIMVAVSSYRFVERYSYAEKLMLLMERAMNDGNYSDLLIWAERYPTNNLLKSYSTSLALIATDRLPYDVLEYPNQFGLDAIAFGSRGGDRKNDYAHHLYALLGLYNEAHRLVWESATVNGYNRMNLPLLSHYNHKMGRDKVAAKFEGLSSKTLFSDSYVVLPMSENIGVDGGAARFINPYNICVDLAYLATKTTLNQRQSDCLMVGLLLSNRVVDFAKYTNYLKLYYSDKSMPQIYDEALAMLKGAMPVEEFQKLGIEPTAAAESRYVDYVTTSRKVRGNGAALKNYSKSYFYYINFISPYGSKIVNE